MKQLQMWLGAALLLAASAMAQSRGNITLDVPFAFAVGAQEFPAGHYVVGAVNSTTLRIEGAKKHGLYVATHGALRTDSDQSKVVFHKYGDKYFLSSVWVTGKTEGREVPTSQDERTAAIRITDMQMSTLRSGMQNPRPAFRK